MEPALPARQPVSPPARAFVRPPPAGPMERAPPSPRLPLPLLLLGGLSLLAARGRGAGGGPGGRGCPESPAPSVGSPPTAQPSAPWEFWSAGHSGARAPPRPGPGDDPSPSPHS